jgi:hypothetical protein
LLNLSIVFIEFDSELCLSSFSIFFAPIFFERCFEYVMAADSAHSGRHGNIEERLRRIPSERLSNPDRS